MGGCQVVSLRTICSGLCRFLVAMIVSSLPAPRRGPQDSHKPWINRSGSGHPNLGSSSAVRTHLRLLLLFPKLDAVP